MIISLSASSLLDLILVMLVFSKSASFSRANAADEGSRVLSIGDGDYGSSNSLFFSMNLFNEISLVPVLIRLF
jgi:hypothetical protein